MTRLELFEWVVAENGALLYHPSTKEEQVLAEPPPANSAKRCAPMEASPFRSAGRCDPDA
jgi:hypothetical protein